MEISRAKVVARLRGGTGKLCVRFLGGFLMGSLEGFLEGLFVRSVEVSLEGFLEGLLVRSLAGSLA